jgi:4-amino-4-deoxy-L-arabinose transferase-like glycosyltransferase
METLTLLLLIGLTAAAFGWLRRRLGEPEAPGQIPDGSTMRNKEMVEQVEPAALAPAAAVYAVPIIPYAPAEPLPTAAVAGAAEVAATPLPSGPVVAAVPEEAEDPLSAARSARAAARVLLLGGAGLLLLSLLATTDLSPERRLGGLLLTAIGGAAILVGGPALGRGSLPASVSRPLGAMARFLEADLSQAAMLVLAFPFAVLARVASGDGLLAYRPWVAIIAWLAAIALAVVGGFGRQRREPRPTLDRWDALAIAVLFAGALALRGWALTSYPSTFSGDEGSAGLFAREILDGKVTNPFTLGWFSFPSLYFGVQSLAIILGGQTIEAIRMTSAVAGALTVVALYLLVRAMFDRTTALLAAAYLAASHFHIHFSRIALNNIWDGLFAVVASLGLWVGWRSGRRSAFILCGLALGLGQYFYVSIRLLPVLFLVWAAAAAIFQRQTFRARLPGLVVAAAVALVVFTPLALRFAAHPDEFQAPMNRVTIFGPWLEGELARGERTQTEILLDQARLAALGFVSEPLRAWYNPGAALLLTAASGLFLIGLIWAVLHFDLRYLLLVLPLLAAVVSTTVSQDTPASQRYVMAMPFVAVFVALPIALLIDWLGEGEPRFRRALPVLAALAIGIVMAVDLNYYFREVYPGYVLGGGNTLVATAIAEDLREQEAADVYFFGFPRMGYFSLSTIPYLAPQMRGSDIIEPLAAPANWPLAGPSLFVFLPERLNELPFVEQSYPGGRYREVTGADGTLLYAVYELRS